MSYHPFASNTNNFQFPSGNQSNNFLQTTSMNGAIGGIGTRNSNLNVFSNNPFCITSNKDNNVMNNVYQTGTRGYIFTPIVFQEGNRDRNVQLQACIITMHNAFSSFSTEELRSIDYNCKKKNANEIIRVEQHQNPFTNINSTRPMNLGNNYAYDSNSNLNDQHKNMSSSGLPFESQNKAMQSFDYFDSKEQPQQPNSALWDRQHTCTNNEKNNIFTPSWNANANTNPFPGVFNSTSQAITNSNIFGPVYPFALKSSSNMNTGINSPFNQNIFNSNLFGLNSAVGRAENICPPSFGHVSANPPLNITTGPNWFAPQNPAMSQPSFIFSKEEIPSIPNDDYLGIKEMSRKITGNSEQDQQKATQKEIEEIIQDEFTNKRFASHVANLPHSYEIGLSSSFQPAQKPFPVNPLPNLTLTWQNERNNSEYSFKTILRYSPFDKFTSYQAKTANIQSQSQGLKEKPFSIEDILPLKPKKMCEIKSPESLKQKTKSVIETKEKIEESKEQLQVPEIQSETNKPDYFHSAEYLKEIERLTQEAYDKGVGSTISLSQSSLKRKSHHNESHLISEKKSLGKYKKESFEMKTIPEAFEDHTPQKLQDISTFNTELSHIDSPKKDKISLEELTNNGLIKLNLKLANPISFEFSVKINPKHKISKLKEAIAETLKFNFPQDFDSLSADNVIICIKTGLLKDTDVIDSKEYLNEREVIQIFIEDGLQIITAKDIGVGGLNNQEHLEDLEMSSINGDGNKTYSNNNEDIVSVTETIQSSFPKSQNPRNEFCPISSKYSTQPHLKDLEKLSKEELERISNFSVFNEHGRITFKGYTDVTCLNLDEIINISPMVVSVYEQMPLPKIGVKLNKEARILLKNVKLPLEAKENEEAYAKFLGQLKEKIERKRAQFLDYNQDTLELIFDVKSFNF